MNLSCLIFALLLVSASATAQASAWDYEGRDTGQDSWADLSPDYAQCRNGSDQSPIAINGAKPKPLPALTFDYQATDSVLTQDRHTVVATPAKPLILREGTRESTLIEMLVRSPSEHQVGDVFYPVELQFVHRAANGERTIVAVFVAYGEPNPALQTILDHYPTHATSKKSARLDWPALLPAKRGYYAYRGSISYPPCEQGISIRVLKTPITMAFEQTQALVKHIRRNSRSVQPVLLRTIFESED